MNQALDRKRTRRAFAGAISGHLIEWYDYGVYGFLAVYVGAAFFASEDPLVNMLSSFAVFALSFFARPIGGLILGPLADRIGRRTALVVALIMMSVAGCVIGLIPSYDTIGIAAPILLVIARLFQGLSAGGEYGTVAAFLSEFARPRRRAFATCWSQIVAICGLLLGAGIANGMTFVLGPERMYDGAWRIPFLLCGPLGVIALIIRLRLEESPEFKAITERNEASQTPLRELRGYVRPVLLVLGVCTLHSSIFYLVLTYMSSFLTANMDFSSGDVFWWTLGTGLLVCVVMPLGAMYSDRVGRRRFLLPIGVAATVAMVGVFVAADHGSRPTFLASLVAVSLCFGLFNSSTTALITELLPTQVRTTGVALGYNLAVAIFGGSAPFIATYLVSQTGSIASPAYFFALTGLVSIAALAVLRPNDLYDESPAAPTETVRRGTNSVPTP
ncbi:MFS transporter [Mycolicibacterium smegmatis]|uniref:Putative proline/betaine transporter n=2 Tax=Mycolicibacterium smegmatis (strain ATCC 700084 / mc(2)155) TaxID=246196 RepID=A0QZD3_MYCS2|nr:MFS transporter [Mycolicibacterium smegmatis]ABK73889.1 integral membrane transport protein [Mycolicibacterium smegmatis MC2 155]AFP40350.1 Putative alpha-ketoglutarate permease [Mycolicibacterium smegmatis MC2 155]AIU09095.1 major facilitator transporter [Mycolicibacterium smegmatis MC2 155]AIU15720.1 major facilitator transporter [Mycolicibacterium smegmatis]AIU22343.1 major facilitator transporter [Mycolicibacterium smegmatis]